MLNPDGVYYGCHRTGLAGSDLNRQWKFPTIDKTPSIYWAKKLFEYMKQTQQVPIFSCDVHGHSRRKNVFIFGNTDCETVFIFNRRILHRYLLNYALISIQHLHYFLMML